VFKVTDSMYKFSIYKINGKKSRFYCIKVMKLKCNEIEIEMQRNENILG
jgi:hypothetical protein